MKRIAIIGSPGLGKTTFARKLNAKTGLPLIHLDIYYHDTTKNYYHDKVAWKARVATFVQQDKWIIDGNYGATMAERFDRADTIVYFDMPRYKAIYGVLKRRGEHINKKRLEMPNGWKERSNLSFLKYVWNFQKNYREPTQAMLKGLSDKEIVVIQSHAQAEEYLRADCKHTAKASHIQP